MRQQLFLALYESTQKASYPNQVQTWHIGKFAKICKLFKFPGHCMKCKIMINENFKVKEKTNSELGMFLNRVIEIISAVTERGGDNYDENMFITRKRKALKKLICV